MTADVIAFIARATRFSPDSVGKDMAILALVRQRLTARGARCLDIVSEDSLTDVPEASAYVSMGRWQDTLNALGSKERVCVPVVNCTASVMLCNQRELLMTILEHQGIDVPPLMGGKGYWVKRGYGCREQPGDVQYAPDWPSACQLRDDMLSRGIPSVDMRAHVEGRWVKCYAVRGTGFFYCYSPETGQPYDSPSLRQLMDRAAQVVQLDVYGADCIVRPDGSEVLVDLNDWPSFSPCRDEASQAIACRIVQRIEENVYIPCYRRIQKRNE